MSERGASSTPASVGGAPASPGALYEVFAIRYATLRSLKRDLYYRYEAYGEDDGDVAVDMDYYFWLIRGEQETILLDTGFHPAAGARRGRRILIEPLQALRRLDVDPATVRTVLVSHLHYDHIGNLAAFADAELIVPAAELDFWHGPLSRRAQYASSVERAELDHVRAAEAEGRVRALDRDEQEIRDGITAIVTGGHSPGQQITLVRTAGGEVLLASDAVHFYEELELDRPFAVIDDLGDTYRAYDRIRRLTDAGAVLVAGHDPDVMRRFPALADEDGLGVHVASTAETHADATPRAHRVGA